MLFNKDAYILTKRALSSSLSQCDAARPASEQRRATAHSKVSCASLAGSSTGQTAKTVMSIPESMGNYSGNLALATRCDKARVYPAIQTQTTPFQWHGAVSNIASKCAGSETRGMQSARKRSDRVQIRPGEWFASVDLKDAYFHIQIAPHHRRFLRFAFEGTAYQYSVLPFGLSLAPRTFSKCMDAALSPLRSSGVRILNYLDDWLILAQSRNTLISHIDSLLIHLESLGLCVNMRKSILTPSQSITYLGVCLDSMERRAHLSREHAAAILSALRYFRQGSSVQLKKFQRLLGLMAAASAVCHLGLLHMRPLQLWLKTRVPWTSGCLNITVSRGCIEALKPWHNPDLFSRGVPLGSVVSHVVVTTDASTHGWGAVCDGMPASGLWLKPQSQWHINRLELEAVFLALKEFHPQLEQQHVLIRTDNTSVVSNINHQGGIRSRALCKRATDILLWADCNLLSIRATHIPGLLNQGADMLSRKGMPQGEWRLHPESVRMIWNCYGRAVVDLFATSENTHCPRFFSLSHSPLVGDALTSHWPAARLYAFPPIKILPLVLCKIREERASVLLITPNWPNQPWFPDLCAMVVLQRAEPCRNKDCHTGLWTLSWRHMRAKDWNALYTSEAIQRGLSLPPGRGRELCLSQIFAWQPAGLRRIQAGRSVLSLPSAVGE